MTFDEVVDGLADVLERSPDMPYVQYMVAVEGRGGLYHLTLTAPGRPTPVETVDSLEKEREYLRGQIAAMEPMGDQVGALQSTVKLLQEQMEQQSMNLQTAVGLLQASMQQQIVGLGAETKSFKELGERFGGEIERLHTFLVDLQGFVQSTANLTSEVPAVVKEHFVAALMGHEEKLKGWAVEARAEVDRRAKEQAAALRLFEQTIQDWAIETRNELQHRSVELVTDTQSNVAAAQELYDQVEQTLNHATEGILRQEAETTEVARGLASAAVERLLALQQDVMRHVTGATAASRESADATLAAVNGARTDVLKYLTDDVAEATKALQRGADLLPEHVALMTKIELLEDEFNQVKGVLDAAERLVHSVLNVSPDLLSPELRELRAQWEAV